MGFYERLVIHQRLETETSRFIYFKDALLSERYDANVLAYKKMPSLMEIQSDIAFVRQAQKDYPSDYVQIDFPENATLPRLLDDYVTQEGFERSTYLIFWATSEDLVLSSKKVEGVSVHRLDEELFERYYHYIYPSLEAYGQVYAQQMFKYKKGFIENPQASIFLALKDESIVGEITAWYHGDSVEFDEFEVVKELRGQGIGSLLEKAAMTKSVSNVILIAEEENRHLYQHQGFKEVGHYQHIFKKYD
ncbi:GNAT family N-acetyltransferase [Streptococcus sp. zg-JUN1979]|uniref:GNAT family N-acetyltransferase n=1 Tax=Streptococcus sp. zg-JUN1979 TaxID=3391450 RepID=UPI0039A6BBAD